MRTASSARPYGSSIKYAPSGDSPPTAIAACGLGGAAEAGIFINHRSHHHHGVICCGMPTCQVFAAGPGCSGSLVRVHRADCRPLGSKRLSRQPLPILRLGVRWLAAGLHRRRGRSTCLALRAGRTRELTLPDGYLDARPLSAADLEQQASSLPKRAFDWCPECDGVGVKLSWNWRSRFSWALNRVSESGMRLW